MNPKHIPGIYAEKQFIGWELNSRPQSPGRCRAVTSGREIIHDAKLADIVSN